MRKFLGTIFLALILYFSWPLIDKVLIGSEYSDKYLEVKEKVELIYRALDESDITEKINDVGTKLIEAIDGKKDEDTTKPSDSGDTVLEADFTINKISLGVKRSLVEIANGSPKSSFVNEFGSKWYVYHQNYTNFLMVSYDENDLVNAIYTNQPTLSSAFGITDLSSQEEIRSSLPNRKTAIYKKNIMLNIENQFDLYDLDEYEISFFYDEKKNNSISAILLLQESLADKKEGFYAVPSEEIQTAFEQQMFEIINSTRVKFNLKPLVKNDPLAITAFNHSKDMATNNFFSHENLQGQSPFDRMEEDQLHFRLAGENLASGQFNSIYAHEALMNSQGHRDNILNKGFEQIGIGIDFNNEDVPYYTMKFFTP